MGILSEFKDLYRYRELLKNLVSRDIKKRYKRSAIGFLWVMLDPLLIMLVFYIIFAGFFGREIPNYTSYVISGITMWQLFAQGTKVAAFAFINNRNLISKLYLPISVFPISIVTSSLVHFIFSLVPLFGIILLSGTELSYRIVFLPIVVGLVFLFAVGVSLTISTVSVFFHDVIYIYDVIIMAWMYLSAIFYPISILPEGFKELMLLNPLYHYITLFRACLYDNTISVTGHLSWGISFAILSFLIGWGIYYKGKDRLIFYL
ncbi:MAG: ABC transporter permease [Thermodesulfovibrionia bacterium]